MGMMMQVLAPGMQDAEEADLGAQVFWIARDGEQRFSAGTKEDVVDDRLVPIGKRGQRCRQGEDDVEVLDGQQLRLALLEPLGALFPLTLGAVAIAAGVVADAQVFTLAAFLDMAAAGPRSGRSRWPASTGADARGASEPAGKRVHIVERCQPVPGLAAASSTSR